MNRSEIQETLKTSPNVGGVEALKFTKVDDYTTFSAEYCCEGNDIVFHFFLPPDSNFSRNYWLKTFPSILEPVVYSVFQVMPPRVEATYVSDLGIDSWWLKAYGFANQIDPDALCKRFFAFLDEELEAVKST